MPIYLISNLKKKILIKQQMNKILENSNETMELKIQKGSI